MDAKSIISMFNPMQDTYSSNVSNVERVAMVALGTYLLYNGTKDEKNIGQITAGTAMLLRGISGYCPMYAAANQVKDDTASNVNIRLSSVVNRPVAEVYAFWRNLENLPRFMDHLQSVKTINSNLSEWTAKGPGGIGTISWKAEIVKEEEDRLLSWQSLADSTIYNAGKVVFKPVGQFTEIDIFISYQAPLGVVGEAAAKLVNPYFEKLIKEDIQNFKAFMEKHR